MDEKLKNDDIQMKNQAENYYEILGCNEQASFSELKQNYQQLIKRFHPDKRAADASLIGDRFVLIDKAYKTLRDEKLRKEYDASLFGKFVNENSLIYAEISKRDLNFDDDGMAYYPCRCGDNFNIEKEYLKETECILECSECTNCILIR